MGNTCIVFEAAAVGGFVGGTVGSVLGYAIELDSTVEVESGVTLLESYGANPGDVIKAGCTTGVLAGAISAISVSAEGMCDS